ncbi:L,D-transpeptidase [Methylopila sp. M107]|uniref:L,D-transpeptidase family protein n=1 Tax=Methylopila sp. M107 TaxID=1101190 RepID=UPI001FD9BF59|nr:L,D-transpeptidase [Methylopila sp. M107]
MARSKLAAATLAMLFSTAGGLHAEPFDLIESLLSSEPRPHDSRSAPRDREDVATTGAIERDPLDAPVEAAPDRRVPAAPRVRPAAPKPAAAADHDYPVDLLISLANDAVFTKDPFPKGQRSDPRMIKLQVMLDRNNASPGVIDGIPGGNVVKAVRAFEEMRGHEVDGVIDAALWAELEGGYAEPALVSYTLTPEDVAGPFVPEMPHDYAEQAQLGGLSYRDAAEMLAERFHMDEAFLRRLNPDVTFAEAGVDVVVANVGKPLKARVAHIIADKELKQLRGYDVAGKLIVAYPATIGSSDTPSPTGTHAVKAIAINPDYWYRPKVNFVQGANTKALRLPPGPNGPVGATWVGLDKPTYGLHGTPEPSKIDKTNSHGCVRLTNWDARELAGLVVPGVPVDFREAPGVVPYEETTEPVAPMAEADPVAPRPKKPAVSPRQLGAPEGPLRAPVEAAPQALEPLPPAREVPYARQSMR